MPSFEPSVEHAGVLHGFDVYCKATMYIERILTEIVDELLIDLARAAAPLHLKMLCESVRCALTPGEKENTKAERAVTLDAGANSKSLPQQRASAERRGRRSEGASN